MPLLHFIVFMCLNYSSRSYLQLSFLTFLIYIIVYFLLWLMSSFFGVVIATFILPLFFYTGHLNKNGGI